MCERAEDDDTDVTSDAGPGFTDRLVIELPLPPSANNAYRNAPGLGRTLTATARKWKADAQLLARIAVRDGPRPQPPVAISFFVWLPNQQRDLDNCLKLCQDAVCAALGFDDRHVQEIHGYRAIDKQHPRVVCIVRTVDT